MLQNPQLHYLDNAATTIVAPEVADVIDKAMREYWANPSSGRRASDADTRPNAIIFFILTIFIFFYTKTIRTDVP